MGYAEIAHCLLEPVEAAQGKKKEGKGPVEVNAPALLQARIHAIAHTFHVASFGLCFCMSMDANISPSFQQFLLFCIFCLLMGVLR